MTHSNIEFASAELQRFSAVSKMTAINYVRDLAGGGVGAARVRRGLALRSPHFVLCSRALHPNRRHCAPSDRVQRAVTGVAPHRGACGRHGGA